MTLTARLFALTVTLFAAWSALVNAQGSAVQPIRPAASTQAQTEMRMYYMVFLRRGPAWTAAVTAETRKISDGHMANIQRLTKDGVMVVAGPFEGQTGDKALAGIFILKVDSLDAAKAAVATDPAVKAGRFTVEILPWWGPASLR